MRLIKLHSTEKLLCHFGQIIRHYVKKGIHVHVQCIYMYMRISKSYNSLGCEHSLTCTCTVCTNVVYGVHVCTSTCI